MNRKRLYTWINVITYVLLLVCSILFNGATAFTITDAQPLITPAAYAFAIWGIIYLLWGLWLIKFGFNSTPYDETYLKVSRFLPISLACSAGSLIVGQPIAGLLILLALISAVFLYISCRRGGVKSTFFNVPVSIYTGWLSVAMIIEVAILLKSNGLSNLFGLSEVFLSILALVFACFIAILVNLKYRDFIYPLVFIWAFIAIAIKNISIIPIFATCCAAILVIAFMMDQIKKQMKQ